MSNFYEDASVVMVPSGYKTSKVYSSVPDDGSADLTFSRSNDTATRVGPDGLIEKVRTNLFKYSEQFNQGSDWSLQAGAIISANAGTAPDGTTTADLLYPSVSAVVVAAIQSFTTTINVEYGQSVYVKAAGKNFAALYTLNGGSGTAMWVNLTTGAITNGSGANVTGRFATDAGNGWWRIGFTDLGNGGTGYMHIYPTDSDSVVTVTSNGTDGILVWGAQMETGVPTDYIETTTSAVSVGPLANIPRLDYSGGANSPSLLLEPQRTNLLKFSESIDNAAWSKGGSPTITTNIATAPDGYGGADGIQSTVAGTYKTVTQNISLSANSTLTISVFVKKETSETAYGGFTMYFQGGTYKLVYGIVDAVNGTVTYADSTLTATTKVEDYGTYWRICSTATDTGSNTLCSVGYYATLSANGTTLDAVAGSVRTIWGLQAEVGAYATSYIPTLSAAVTRGVDEAYKTGVSSLIGQTEGTVFVEVEARRGGRFALLGSGTNFMELILTSSGRVNAFVYNGATQVNFDSSSIYETGATLKVAFAYKENDFVLYVNGAQEGTDTSGAIPSSMSQIKLNSYTVTGYEYSQYFKQALLFQTRLSNADLSLLTTL